MRQKSDLRYALRMMLGLGLALATLSCNLSTPPDPEKTNPLDGRNPNALPEIESVTTMSGSEFTNSLNTTLRITTHAATQIKVSQVADLISLPTTGWIPAPTNTVDSLYSVTLDSGDGTKLIACQARALNGSESAVVYSIVKLDTRAAISSLTWLQTGGDTLAPDTLKFNLNIADDVHGSEENGTAYIEVEGLESIILLNKASGVYAGDYLITARTPNISNALVIAHFRDRTGNHAPEFESDKKLTVSSYNLLSTLTGFNHMVNSVAFSPNGSLLACGFDDNVGPHENIRLWRTSDWSLVSSLTGSLSFVTSVAFSPDGSQLVSGYSDYLNYKANLWQVSDGTLLLTLTGHTEQVNSVAFSSDGTLLASGSSDKTTKLWRASSGTLIQTLTGYSNQVTSVAFSPDGSRLASGSWGHSIKLWQVSNWTLLQTFTGHSSSVFDVTFSPDGTLLASGSADNSVRLWRVSDGTLLRTLTGHTDEVTSVAFSPDGTLLASGSRDNTIKLWR